MPKNVAVTPASPFALTGNQTLDALLTVCAGLDPANPARAIATLSQAAQQALAARAAQGGVAVLDANASTAPAEPTE